MKLFQIQHSPWIIAAFLAFLLLSGCATPNNTSTEQAVTPPAEETKQPPVTELRPPAEVKPVKIQIGIPPSGYYNEREFDQFIVQPVKQKYPHITIQRIDLAGSDTALEKLMVANEVPDIMISSSLTIDRFTQREVAINLEPLIRQQQIDLGQFKSIAIEYTKTAGRQNYLLALPYNHNYSAMVYNKAIFDKFATPYPQDNITWQDTIQLARRVTRLEDGIQYRGLEITAIIRPASALQLQRVNPQTMQAAVNTDGWKRLFETMRDMYTIPGNNEITQDEKTAFEQFIQQQRLAMLANLNLLTALESAPDHLPWDLAQYPQFPEAPNTGINFGAHIAMISSTSAAKEAAMQVISVMVSNEVQLDAAKWGRITVLNRPEMIREYGSQLSFLKGKNIQSIFKAVPAKPTPPTPFDNNANPIINNKMQQVLEGKDINTALREAEEELNKMIREKK